jgi:SRSO17 transposase
VIRSEFSKSLAVNCQAAVSLSVSTWNSSLPVAWRLYLPEVRREDAERCRRPGVPEEIGFQTKPEIALEQIRQAMEQGAPVGVVLADAGYGKGTQFRTDLTQLGLQYAVGIESNVTVWELGQQPLPAPARRSGLKGRTTAIGRSKILAISLRGLGRVKFPRERLGADAKCRNTDYSSHRLKDPGGWRPFAQCQPTFLASTALQSATH